mgnify:CR=1 FL=1
MASSPPTSGGSGPRPEGPLGGSSHGTSPQVSRGPLRVLLGRSVRVVLVAGLLYMVAGYLTARLGPQPPLGVETLDYARVDAVLSEPARSQVVRSHVVRGALSVHSGRSHDAEGTLDEVARAARKADLDFVVLGDHPEVWTEAEDAFEPRWMDDALIVPGVEMVVADRGRVLAVGLDTVPRRWEASLSSLISRVDTAHGFVSVVHPRSPRNRERWKDQAPVGVHAWESFDVSEMARSRLSERWALYHIGGFLMGLPTGRADEVVVGMWRERTATPAILAYDTIRSAGPTTLTGGLNHHPKARVPGGLFPAYAPFFQSVVNHVTLPAPLSADPRTARQQLMAALRAGAVHVSLGHPDRVEGFRFWVETPDEVAVQGGRLETPSPGDATLRVRIPDDAPGRVYVRFVQDGGEVLWAKAEAGETIVRVGSEGVHRVEIHHAGRRVPLLGRLNLRPWILSNPIEIRRADPDGESPRGTS